MPAIPVVEDLDRRILDAIESGGALQMEKWHTCETTHCLAGWAIHLAGSEGYKLEAKVGANCAGALIYHASTGLVPDFFACAEQALDGLRRRARPA